MIIPAWAMGLAFASIVALQSWILLEIVGLKTANAAEKAASEGKFRDIEHQLGRIVSDAESEKGTRKRVHSDFETRIRHVEVEVKRST